MKSSDLKPYQKLGVKFLRTNFEKHQSCVLNDDVALGKTVQIVDFLQTICHNDDTKRALVVTENSEKILHWKYHLDTFSQLTYSTACDSDENTQVVLTVHHWGDTNRKYNVVVLETDLFDQDLVEKLKTDMIVFKTSVDITLNLNQLYFLANYCMKHKINLSLDDFTERYDTTATDSRRVYFSIREKLLTLCRPFRLRRQKFSLKDELPLIEPDVFNERFGAWMRLHADNPIGNQQPIVKTLSAQSSEPFLAFERDTQAMSPLIFDSESECGDLDGYNAVRPLTPKMLFENITLPKLVPAAKPPQVSPPSSPLSIPETQPTPKVVSPKDTVEESEEENDNCEVYDQCGQIFQYSLTSTPGNEPMNIYTQLDIGLDPARLPVRPKTPSPEVEVIVEPLNTPIYVTSSNSAQGSGRRRRKKPACYSPDLFAATSEDEAEETEPSVKIDSPLNNQITFLNILNQTSVLAVNFDVPATKEYGSPLSKELANAIDENVFEITANEEFCNQLRINSDTEMSPIRVTDSDEATNVDTPERKKLQKRKHAPVVYDILDSEEMDAERENDNKTPDRTPSQRTPSQRSSSKQRKSVSKGKTRSPMTPQVIKSTGWLSTTPSTSFQACSASPKRKHRRRKLESMLPRKVFSCDNEPCSTAAIRMGPSSKHMRQFIISPDRDY